MLNSLTSFRFIAALMVFVFHLEVFSQFQLGSAGVQFFFVLSGFILAYNYHSKFSEVSRKNLKNFYRARFAKVYPVHLLTFIIAAPLVILYFKPDGLYFIKFAFMSAINLLLVQSFIPNEGTYFNFNGVSWTLSVEALFYLTFPFLIWTFTKLKVVKNVIIAVVAIVVVWVVLFILNVNLNESSDFQKWVLHIFPVARMFEFSTGVIMGIIFAANPKREVSNKKLLSFLEILSVVLFIAALLFSIGLDVGIVRGVYFVPIWCLLIYTFAHNGGLLSKALSNRLLVYLGEISFSFYMIHQLVIRYYEYFNLETTYKFLICLVLSLLLSAAMFKYYEEPMRKILRYGAKKKQDKGILMKTPA
ncbi:acyltransferase [Paenibacillus sp. FSL A5-0031]|uniref:acyltransferase family protein n=1 Tax=Paenibacillus sp. FSL A5-0031 TaxID=1920420 RepID=UPI00096CD80F|nr:acyltransferase [Paenibacillus sp. FSL A5-0031]OME86915.1 acyltransferase [Paenibacillus sp. FSL A5-0031]